MDVDMPVMDGLTAVRHIRSLERKSAVKPTPIIATTAHAMAHDHERFLEAGMDDYIPKPIQEHALLTAIEKWAAQKLMQSADAA